MASPATARVRELSRGGSRKNDVIDDPLQPDCRRRVHYGHSTDRRRPRGPDRYRQFAGAHPPGEPFRLVRVVRHLLWRRTDRSGQRRSGPAPPSPRRRSPVRPSPAQVALTRVRTRGSGGRAYYHIKIAAREDPRRSDALPEKAVGRSPLETHDLRRASSGRPGRTLGGGSAIQRGWLNPDHQLFGQVTSRTGHTELYDPRIGRSSRDASLGHQAVGTIVEIGSGVRNLTVGIRSWSRAFQPVAGAVTAGPAATASAVAAAAGSWGT